MFIGANLIHITELDSTNRFAMELVRNTLPPEGTTISADFQTAGRGQQGKHWLSRRGENINCSIILYPGFLRAQDQFLLNMAIALAVCAAASELSGAACALKWPNDVVYQHKKIAGILIENSWVGHRWQAAIVGIGLNLNQQDFEGFPASSLRNIAGITMDADYSCRVLFRHLEARYLMLQGPRKEHILNDYNEQLVHQGSKVDLALQDGSSISAAFLRAERSGGICIKTDEGALQTLHHPGARIIL